MKSNGEMSPPKSAEINLRVKYFLLDRGRFYI
jgi:hypothetical protein